MSKEDLVFLASQKNSEHMKVFTRLIETYKTQTVSAIIQAKDDRALHLGQGVLRGLTAIVNTLNTGILQGDTLIKEAERQAEKAAT